MLTPLRFGAREVAGDEGFNLWNLKESIRARRRERVDGALEGTQVEGVRRTSPTRVTNHSMGKKDGTTYKKLHKKKERAKKAIPG